MGPLRMGLSSLTELYATATDRCRLLQLVSERIAGHKITVKLVRDKKKAFSVWMLKRLFGTKANEYH